MRIRSLGDEVERVLAGGGLDVHVQPIVDLTDGGVIGWEALTRFGSESGRSTESWFEAAYEAGLAVELERAALVRAVALLDGLPSPQFLSVNLSAAALEGGVVEGVVADLPLDRLVIELTEQHLGGDRDVLADVLDELRGRGVRLAMDDVGAGYAGLERVLRLHPDLIKLDRELVAGVAVDSDRQAMVSAFVGFASAVGAKVIAEGIEEQADATAIRRLGVDLGQGYAFGRPAPAPWIG